MFLKDYIMHHRLKRLSKNTIKRTQNSNYSIHSKKVDDTHMLYLNTLIRSKVELSYEDACYHILHKMLNEMLHDLVKYHLVDIVSTKNSSTGVITYDGTLKIVTQENAYVTYVKEIQEDKKSTETSSDDTQS